MTPNKTPKATPVRRAPVEPVPMAQPTEEEEETKPEPVDEEVKTEEV